MDGNCSFHFPCVTRCNRPGDSARIHAAASKIREKVAWGIISSPSRSWLSRTDSLTLLLLLFPILSLSLIIYSTLQFPQVHSSTWRIITSCIFIFKNKQAKQDPSFPFIHSWPSRVQRRSETFIRDIPSFLVCLPGTAIPGWFLAGLVRSWSGLVSGFSPQLPAAIPASIQQTLSTQY